VVTCTQFQFQTVIDIIQGAMVRKKNETLHVRNHWTTYGIIAVNMYLCSETFITNTICPKP